MDGQATRAGQEESAGRVSVLGAAQPSWQVRTPQRPGRGAGAEPAQGGAHRARGSGRTLWTGNWAHSPLLRPPGGRQKARNAAWGLLPGYSFGTWQRAEKWALVREAREAREARPRARIRLGRRLSAGPRAAEVLRRCARTRPPPSGIPRRPGLGARAEEEEQRDSRRPVCPGHAQSPHVPEPL